MKVLMFGWEFPPHITGGLGTACFGLTKGLSKIDNLDITFVVPKAYGDEDMSVANILNASEVSVLQKKSYTEVKETEEIISSSKSIKQSVSKEKVIENNVFRSINYVEIASLLLPYVSIETYEKIINEKKIDKSLIKINEKGELTYIENGIEKNIKLDNIENIEFETKGKFNFSGKYGSNLIQEVNNYALVAAAIAQNQDFDIIHAHDWLTYYAGIAAKKVSGKPLVIHIHATEFDRSGENVNQLVYDIERAGLLYADKVIAVSNLTRNIVVNKYGINPDKVVTVHNAVEPTNTETLPVKRRKKEKIVTFLGRVTFQKGPEYFVEAAYKVLQKTDNVRFVMAGSGDLLRRMIRRVGKLKIADKFHFTDFLKQDDVNKLFNMSDVYVMPSVSEPFGISPLEAMRSNVPVIISKQSGVAEILHHAIKVDFWDIDAIADSIYGLVKYDGLSKMFSRFGKNEVDNLKWENAAILVKKVYDSAVY